MKVDPYLLLVTKLIYKWIKYFNINPTTLNPIEEKVGSALKLIGTEEYFLNKNLSYIDTERNNLKMGPPESEKLL